MLHGSTRKHFEFLQITYKLYFEISNYVHILCCAIKHIDNESITLVLGDIMIYVPFWKTALPKINIS